LSNRFYRISLQFPESFFKEEMPCPIRTAAVVVYPAINTNRTMRNFRRFPQKAGSIESPFPVILPGYGVFRFFVENLLPESVNQGEPR
jgi:hypothetical protein